MSIIPSEYYESWKRYWRRRKYRQRIKGGTRSKKKKLQILRLGAGADAPRPRFWRIRIIRKLRRKIISPTKLLAKFHDAYVDMMIGLANKMANSNSNGGFIIKGKKATKAPPVSLVVSSGEQVDSRLVMEIYKQLAASRQSNTEI